MFWKMINDGKEEYLIYKGLIGLNNKYLLTLLSVFCNFFKAKIPISSKLERWHNICLL
jgi:hypothetical protein